MHLSADALEVAGVGQDDPTPYTGLRESYLVGLCYVPASAAARRSSVTGWQHSGQAPRMRASTICSSCRTW
jgi:hypothetical protein